MYHNVKSVPRKDKPHDLGVIETFNFKHVSSMGLTYNVLACGEETISEAKQDRVLIVKEGLAHVNDTNFMLRDGDVYEIPAGTSLKIQGQLKYYMMISNN